MPRISQLPSDSSPSDSDELVMVDVDSATTKKITRDDFFLGSPLPDDTVTTGAIEDGAVTFDKLNLSDKPVAAYSGSLTGVANTSTLVPLSTAVVTAKGMTKATSYLEVIKAGIYQANVSFTATASGLGILEVRKGAAGTSSDSIVAEFGIGVANERGGGACIFECTAGQRISFTFRSPAGSSNLTAQNLGVTFIG